MTVRVWDLSVRVIHWTIFFSTVVLAVTGLYIGNPILVSDGRPENFLMGTYREVHRLAAWVFGVALASRLVLMFTGSRYARWDQFIPVSAERRRGIAAALRYYLFLRRETPPGIGHNPLAGLTYSVVYLMLAFQVWTGLCLASLAVPGSALAVLTGWTFQLVPIPTLRLVHHLVTWLIIGFTIHHVYSATLVDVEEGSGVLSSIVTGRKRVREVDG